MAIESRTTAGIVAKIESIYVAFKISVHAD